MKKMISFLILLIWAQNTNAQIKKQETDPEKVKIAKVLDDLNYFASKADFNHYFSLFAEESTFIGTDATEIWNKSEFMKYAKPYFDKGKAWSFTTIKRNMYYSKDKKIVYFDELLDTQMKICRGSGVLEKVKGDWKIKQYVLSVTVPNEVLDQVIQIKTPLENEVMQNFKKN